MSADGDVAASREVVTASGRIVGRHLLVDTKRPVDAFLGVPYAKPPIGKLRFQKPQPPEPWTDVLQATAHPPQCPQIDIKIFEKPEAAQDENMLFLNVFTPTWKHTGKGFPVMFFIHGGAYLMGGNMQYGDVGIAEHLVSKDVIVITVQYRLGFFGFFTTGDEACSGNMGLWDLTEALHWVQRNICAFGGDKDNVTVWGQSAGGALAEYLMLSPHSNGLFNKAIQMSGSANCSWAMNELLKEICADKMEELGITAATSQDKLEQLRAVPADKLLANMRTAGRVSFEATPIIDGDFLAGPVAELRRHAPHKPILTGVVRLECGMQFDVKATHEDVQNAIARAVPAGVADRLLRICDFLSLYEKDDENDLQHIFQQVISDEMFNVGFAETVRDSLKIGWSEPIFAYRFDRFNPAAVAGFPVKAAPHCTDLAYLFGAGYFNPFDMDQKDRAVMATMTTAFTNFAKVGDPNGAPGEPTELPVQWEPATSEHPERNLIIDTESRMENAFFDGRLLKYAQLQAE